MKVNVKEINLNGMNVKIYDGIGICPVMKAEKNGVIETYEGMDFMATEICSGEKKIRYWDDTNAYKELHRKAFSPMDDKWLTWAARTIFYGEQCELPKQELPVEKA